MIFAAGWCCIGQGWESEEVGGEAGEEQVQKGRDRPSADTGLAENARSVTVISTSTVSHTIHHCMLVSGRRDGGGRGGGVRGGGEALQITG